MSNHRRSNQTLNTDQRILLELYLTLYNQTTRQIESLRDIQTGLIQDIRSIANIQQTNANHINPSTNNTRARNQRVNTENARDRFNRPNTNQTNARRTYYDDIRGIYYIDGIPYRFDFSMNNLRNPTGENRPRPIPIPIPRNTQAFNDILWNNFDTLYSNIIVRPTAQEIELATRNVSFSQIINPINTNCPISLEPFDESSIVTQINGCGHVFNREHLHTWFERNVRCPVCRYDIRGNESVLPNDIEQPSAQQNSNSDSATINTVPLTDVSNNEVTQSLANLTETILTNLLNPDRSRITVNHENSRILYDPSNNEIIFQGFY